MADIGGYTTFLQGVGIEHAKEITSHLFNGMLKVNKDRWKVGNVVGDCLFFYAEGREEPEPLFQHLRTLYGEFRGSVTDIAARSTCHCGACTRTSELRLKFIVHAGQYDTQNIGGRTELIGPDIVVAHRLLKNSVPLAEYALLTPAVGDTVAGLASTPGSDSYEDVGTIEYVYFDLAPLKAEYEQTSQVFIGEKDAKLVVKTEVDAPPDVVYRALTDTDERREWQLLKEFDRVQGESGKLGEVHRCVHGDGTEFVHVTVGVDEAGRRHTEKMWISGWMSRVIKETYATLEARPLPDERTEAVLYGTMVPRVPVLGDAFVMLGARMMRGVIEKDFASLKSYCEGKVRVG
jgi:uncharacterized protein YndB with AHSA1/START domain